MKNFLRVVIAVLMLTEFGQLNAQFPGCPQVVTDPTVHVPCGQTCANLYATALGGYATNNYRVDSIAYAPFSYTAGTAINVDTDDLWSQIVNLPFTFCYFGVAYTQLIASANGAISFSNLAANSLNFANWTIPGPAPLCPLGVTDMCSAIMGPYQDMDNKYQGTMRYFIGGTAPCRYLVVSWSDLAMYGDSLSSSRDNGVEYCSRDDHQTSQIILYETSNVIDINILNKGVSCNDQGLTTTYASGYWNNGWAIEGIENNGIAFTVPGRNATQWTAQNDAWRFSPYGLPTYTISWFQGGTQVGTGNSFNACPAPGGTTYTAKATYTDCDNSVITVSENVFVDLAFLTSSDSLKQPTCAGNNGSVYANFNGNSGVISYGWAPGGAGQTTVNNLGAGTYIFTVTDSAGCTARDTAVLIAPGSISAVVANDTFNSCSGNNGTLFAVVTGTGPFTYAWSGTAATTDTITGLAAGTYTVTVTGPGACTATATGTVVANNTPPGVTLVKLVNASCSASNGEILVNGANGSPPYSYNWSNIGSGPDSITGLTAGNYSVTVTDRLGCTATAAYTINQSGSVSFNAPVITNVSCKGGNNGSITVSNTGGIKPYTYGWSNTGTTATISNLTAGTYNVTVTDSVGCTATASYTVTQPSGIGFLPPVIVNVTCFGDSSGSITVSDTGGTAPYHYSWSNSGTTATISNLTAGTYNVTVTDTLGCSASATYTVTQGTAVTIVLDSLINVSCNGGNGGKILVHGTGGAAPYSYNWSNIGSGPDSITGLAAGNYSLTVTDRFGCTATASYTINQPTALGFLPPVITNVTCFGGNNGSITVSDTGGTKPYSFSWSNSGTTSTISNLTAGTYIVTVTDAAGCTVTASYDVTQPAQIVVDTAVIDSATCQAGGTIILTASGGTGTLTFAWSNLGTGDSIGGLAAGSYTVTITDSSGCSMTASYVVPAAPDVVQFGPPVFVQPTCNGGSDGSITATAFGGTGPISFAWSNIDSVAKDSNLVAGAYSVTITDSVGCSASTTYVLNQPAPLTITNVVIDSVSCNGGTNGSIFITVTGGTTPYFYNWGPPNTGTTDSVTGLSAGTYTVTVTDSLGCATTATYNVDQPAPIVVDSAVLTQQTCVTGGTIVVYASGGTGALTYGWSNSGTGDSIGNLNAGSYTVTITDQNGCNITATYTVTALPGVVTITDAVINGIKCFGDTTGNITVFATDSSVAGPITYLWATGATTQTISNLGAGTYCVTATDSVGCTASACFTIAQPNAITFDSAVLVNPNCNGDSSGCITASATGGSGPITYSWSNAGLTAQICSLTAGTYVVTATDSVGCTATASYTIIDPLPVTINSTVTDITCNGLNNGSIIVSGSGGNGGFVYSWNNNALGDTLTNLSQGQYCVTVLDAKFCSATACYNINNPPALVINSMSTTPVTCAQLGTSIAFASGGTGKLVYTWSNGEVGNVDTALTVGVYCVTVADSSGCTVTGCDTVLSSPGVVTIDSATVTNLTCNGAANGSITVFASADTSGGTITFLWSNNATTATITKLSAGQYCVTATDSTGCTATACYTVTEPTAITFNQPVLQQPTCAGNDGCITASATGGTGTITYNWGNVGTAQICSLSAGSYTVTATDSSGCTATATYTLNAPTGLTVVTSFVTPAGCGGLGSIGVVISGGTPQYTYAWSGTNRTTDTITGLAVGTYILTVTDNGSCSLKDTFQVTGGGGSLTVASVVIDSVSCNGGKDGSITITVTGGSSVYTYAWSNQEFSAKDSALIAGTYQVLVLDSSGCSVTGSYTVSQPSAISLTGVATNAGCNTLGSIVLTTTGGNPGYSWAWTPSQGNVSTASNLTAGTYTVTATDQKGCSATNSFNITGGTTLTVGNATITPAGCGTLGSVSISPSGGGGAGTYTYVWSGTNQTTATITNLNPGSYSVTVTSGNCTATGGPYVVTQSSGLTATVNPITPIICRVDSNGKLDSTGVISVNVTGGAGPFRYHWSTNDTTQTVSGLSPFQYAVTVTDASGCSASAIGVIQRDEVALFFFQNPGRPNCTTTSLAITLTPQPGQLSGISPYVFELSGGGVNATNTTGVFTGLAPGTYVGRITDSLGCKSVPTSLTTTPLAHDSIGASTLATSCTSVSDGQLTAYVAKYDSVNGPFQYSINGGAFQSDSNFTNLAPGSYQVVVKNSEGCLDTLGTPVIVTSDSVLSVSFAYDTIGPLPPPGAINTDTVFLRPIISGFRNPVFEWSPGTGLSCTNCDSPQAIVTVPTYYLVMVSDSANRQCFAYDSILILPKGLFDMPDGFTPNGDGKNDEFGPIKYSYLTITTFHIYNRWGQLVHNANEPWDGKFNGKDQPAGVYVYYIEIQRPDGYNYGTMVTQKREGHCILLR